VEFAAGVIDLHQALAGFFVAQMTGQTTELCPPAIAIHDEGDMIEFLAELERFFLCHG
jgi:hypothetical protein